MKLHRTARDRRARSYTLAVLRCKPRSQRSTDVVEPAGHWPRHVAFPSRQYHAKSAIQHRSQGGFQRSIHRYSPHAWRLHRKTVAQISSQATQVRIPGFSALISVLRRSRRTDSVPWSFDQAPDCAALTLCSIVLYGAPILCVSHDAEDHGWQFLGLDAPDEADAAFVSLEQVVKLDPSVLEIADLPPGSSAWRESRSAPWQRTADEPLR